MVKIGDIASAIPNCEIIGIVALNSERTYDNGKKYANVYIEDDGDQIKLTVWGDDVAKVLKLEVNTNKIHVI